MGCDIHIHTELRNRDTWVAVPLSPPVWDWRDYGLFGLLAGVRNYSAVEPIAKPRGFPNDACAEAVEDFEGMGSDAHTPSYLTLQELTAIDYDASIVDRRVTRQTGPSSWDGGCTGTIDEGERTTLRAFLGERYFNDLSRMQEAGVERVVFWFDN